MPIQPLVSASEPKSSRTRETNEDAYAWVRAGATVWLAVADGTSEGAFTGQWARILVAAICQPRRAPEQPAIRRDDGPIEQKPPAMPTLGTSAWLGQLFRRAAHVFEQSLPSELPWYLEASLDRGVSATLAAARLDLSHHRLTTVVVGDCCVAYWTDRSLPTVQPSVTLRDFKRPPDTVTWSRTPLSPTPQPRLHRHTEILRGLSPFSELYVALMTDALAEWFVRRIEENEAPHRQLQELCDASFPAWVHQQRASRLLRDDDTTLLLIRVTPPSAKHRRSS